MTGAILGDWGGSRLRLWLVRDGIVAGRRDGPGISDRSRPFRETLTLLTADWPKAHIILCGMAGSRDGLHEVAYAGCPVDAVSWSAARVDVGDRIRIAAGLTCVNALGAPDVMRGEETQIFGALRLDPTLADMLAITPGTHSKWVEVDGGGITRFTTAPTGEVFALLRQHSMLIGDAVDIDPAGFDDGVGRIKQHGAVQLLPLLFEARSQQLRGGKAAAWAAGFVSGLLIGAEIEAGQALFSDRQIVLIGDDVLSGYYVRALAHWDRAAQLIDGETAAISGLMLLEEMP